MTIEQLRNILGTQSEQRKTIDEWGQKRSFWLKLLRIDTGTAYNFFKKEIDDFTKDITSFFRAHIAVLCILIALTILSLIVLICSFGFQKNNVLILIGLVLQALGGGYILCGFIFPIKGLRPQSEPHPVGQGNIIKQVFINPKDTERSFKDIVEIINENANAMKMFQIKFSKDQIIRSKLELRKWIAQGVCFFIMVVGILLQILGLII